MKQGDSSLSAESKSAPVTAAAAATSSPTAQHYKCRKCSRHFKTSRARCSHQITHRMASEMRMKPYGAVLGAVLIHHIPSDDEDEINGPPSDEPEPEPEPAPKKRSGSTQKSAKVVKAAKVAQVAQVARTKINAKGKESAVTISKPKGQAPPAKQKAKTSTTAGSSQPRSPIKKAPVLEKPDQQQKQKPQQPKQQQPLPEPEPKQLQTKDLLGEWNPMCIVRGEVEGSGSSWELTLDLAAARVLNEMGDDLDLELNLCSMNNKNVDLELKLGF